MDQQTLQSFQSQLNNVTNVLIATRPNPTFDAISSVVSLALSFEKAQKKVTVFCQTPLTVEFGNLIGINKVATLVGNKNLIVTINGYAKAGIDKVSYNVEGDNFNLVVVPKPGVPAFDQKNISYSYSGVDAQLVVLVDVQSLDQLGSFYERDKDFFTKTPIANVDSSSANTNYGTFNLTNQAASSSVEITGYLLQYLKYQVDSDIATNILYGLMKTTNNLNEAKVRAETYELVGMMMRLGARRVQVMQFLGGQMLSSAQTQPVVPVNQYIGKSVDQYNGNTPIEQPIQQTSPSATSNVATVGTQQQPPADWTQPKIYKGGSLG